MDGIDFVKSPTISASVKSSAKVNTTEAVSDRMVTMIESGEGNLEQRSRLINR